MDEFWINPLGLDDNITKVDGATDPIDYSEVVHNLKVALGQIDDLKKFLIKKYNIDPDSLTSQKHISLIKIDLYDIQNVNTGFKKMYHTLQKFGAAFYHIIMNANNDKYKYLLNKTKINMIQILCGIQNIVLVSRQKPDQDYKYEEMRQIIGKRKLNGIDDFVIIREFENFLKIIKDIFESRSKVQKKRKNGDTGHRKKAKH